MEVFQFDSSDGRVQIRAATVADVRSLWSRFRSRIKDAATAQTYCDYGSTLTGSLWLANPLTGQLEAIGEEGNSWAGRPPVFYETVPYVFNLRLSGVQGQPTVIHRLKEVSDLFTATRINDGDWLLTAPLSFLNEPGIFELSLRYAPVGEAERTDTLSFRIVSPKLDTKDDYIRVLEEINREYNEIVFRYLSMTLQNLTIDGHSRSDVVWLAIFFDVIEGYIKSVKYIAGRPHLTDRRETYFSHADRIKLWSPQMARDYHRTPEEQRSRAYFRHDVTESTRDTRENRFVKFTIERISRRLEAIFRGIKERNLRAKAEEKVSDEELARLDSYQKDLRKLANSPLLRNLRGEPLRSESIVLQKRTGYAQVYRYWLTLQKGIELHEGASRIGVRPIWELYELWCFLKMRKMVATILGLSFDDPEQIAEQPMPMLEPFSDNNQEHTVHYHAADSEVRLHYQHTYNRASGDVHTATTDNRPDIVLTIRRPDGFELTYLFDAKYRVSDDSEFSREDRNEIDQLRAADYPPSDAINQMHRYRDAIYYGEKYENVRQHSAKEIIGGYILFPGRGDDEAIRNRYFYKSIATVNIGAFPLLPDHANPNGEGTLLREFLTRVLTQETAYEQISTAIPQKGLVYSRSVAESNDLVLVGAYKDQAHLATILERKLYYVPAGLGKGSINLASGFENAKYLLLHRDNDRQLYALAGNGPKFFTAKTLADMGFHPSGDYYLGYELKSALPVSIDGLDLAALPIFKTKFGYRSTFITFKELTGQ